jgi:flagellar motility protein MotE (MotC chaperone)
VSDTAQAERLAKVEARLDAVESRIDDLLDRLTERAEAQAEAIKKAENAQASYNIGHNDLTRKMEAQSRDQMPRLEVEGRLKAVEEKAESHLHALEERVGDLRTLFAAGGGVAQGGKALKEETRANLALLISVLSLVALLVFALLNYGKV